MSVGNVDGCTALHDGLEHFFRRHIDGGVDPELPIDGSELIGGQKTADDAFAVMGLESINAAVLVGKLVPYGEEQAGNECQTAIGELRDTRDLVGPRRLE